MKIADLFKALGVALATLVITLAASFPMVAFYAYFIEPGHPQEFYNEAALWIAPWSSHVLGPLCFLAFLQLQRLFVHFLGLNLDPEAGRPAAHNDAADEP